MYCKFFKLVTGEAIIGVTENADIDHEEITTTVFDPIKVEFIRLQGNNSFMDTVIIKPLLPMSQQDYVVVRNLHVVYDAHLAENYVHQYTEFIQSKNYSVKAPLQEPQAQPPIPTENHLDLTDSDESEEEDFFNDTPIKPTLH